MLEEMDEEFGISELIDESVPIMPIKREVYMKQFTLSLKFM